MIEYRDYLCLSILKVVKLSANTNILVNEDFEYTDLLFYINLLKKNGLIRSYMDQLELTKKGYSELERLEKLSSMGNIGNMIVPDIRYFVEKIGINTVYLP